MIQIVQCWDDGVVDDIRLVEILRKHDAKATFNLNPGLHSSVRGNGWRFRDCKDVLRMTLGELAEVYRGFSIANHSMTHPFPLKIELAEWKTDVEDGKKHLEDLFGRPIPGFAYPFGQTSPEIARVVEEAGHTYARTTMKATPCFPPASPFLFAPDCHFLAKDFWERLERAKTSPGGVFYFWGHSYELVTDEEWSGFEQTIQRLSADPELKWVDVHELFSSGQG